MVMWTYEIAWDVIWMWYNNRAQLQHDTRWSRDRREMTWILSPQRQRHVCAPRPCTTTTVTITTTILYTKNLSFTLTQVLFFIILYSTLNFIYSFNFLLSSSSSIKYLLNINKYMFYSKEDIEEIINFLINNIISA